MKWAGRYKGYDAKAFRKDLLSGLIVGIIAIPLGMAFAIASGVKPEYGIYTTIIAGIIISILGGSKFQIGGPTGAFIPILFAIVMTHGYENLLIAGFMAGILLVLMGLLRLGVLIKYIPKPVTIGFTAGIAVTIFSGQIANFFGLTGIEKHEDFFSNMREIVIHFPTLNVYSIMTAGIGLIVTLLVMRYSPKVPASLVGLIVSSVVATLLFQGDVATIGSTYGSIPSTLPSFHVPNLTWDRIELLIGPAFVIAMLGGIESLLSAVVADGMSGGKHDSNRELIGQGVANMITPLFGGIPATGAIARTATNIKNGAASPFSGVIHGVTVLLVLVLFAPYASHIPLASMAPILMMVAWNMSEHKGFARIARMKSSDSIVLLITFLLTVFTELTTAVEVGLILAVILFVKRMSEILMISKVLPDPSATNEKVKAHMVTEGHDCPQIGMYTFEGPLFFGASNAFEKSITDITSVRPKVLVMLMGKMPFMDTTGESNLAGLVKHFKKRGGTVLVAGVQPQPQEMLIKTGLYEEIGESNFFNHTGEAIDQALTELDHHKCLGCKHFVFRECAALTNVEGQQELIAFMDRRRSAKNPNLSPVKNVQSL